MTYNPSFSSSAIALMNAAIAAKQDAGNYALMADLLWGNIGSKPSTYDPSTHSHSISDVTGLQTALDGKQASGSYSLTSHSHNLDAVADTASRVAFLPAERTKLSGIATGATANDTDANLKARANHTGTQSLDTTSDSATRLAMTSAERTKLAGILSAVKYTAAGSALGSAIADYFTSTISLEANSIYEIECHAYFLKTTAGTVTWTWLFSSAPVMATSRYRATPITGFTTSVITGAEVFAEATQEASTTLVHAASGSLTTAVRHSFIFTVRVVTNGAATIQLRCTESAGTVTPQNGSYMRATKIL